MAKIPDSFIKQLLQRVDIVHVIGQYVHVKKAGKNYKGLCPFHKEKTPSFSIDPQKQRYKCFGCEAQGDAIDFVQAHSSHTFVDAVEILASMYGMAVPREHNNFAKNKKDTATNELLISKVYACLDLANKFFCANLKNHNISINAINYLKKRSITGVTAKTFFVGYAPSGWDNLIKYLQNYVSLDEMIAAGVVIKNDKGKIYDRFRDRIVFPIKDRKGRIIGFGGRVVRKEDEPKYLNSPETCVFNKGSELYGLSEIRQELSNYTNIIIVEGYLDVISLWQNGIKNSVATLGTSFTEQHLKILLHLKNELIFCFDGDIAGQKAAWRALELCLPFIDGNKQVKFLILPDNLDPDAFVIKHGKDAFLEQVKRSISLLDFIFLKLSKDLDLDHIDGRSKLIANVKPLIAGVKQNYIKQMLFERLALASGIDQNLLQKDLVNDFVNVRNVRNVGYEGGVNFKNNSESTNKAISSSSSSNSYNSYNSYNSSNSYNLQNNKNSFAKSSNNFKNDGKKNNQRKFKNWEPKKIKQSFGKPQRPLSPAIRACALLLHSRKLLNVVDKELFDYIIDLKGDAIFVNLIPGGKFFLALIDILKQNLNVKDEEISQLLPAECVKYYNPKELSLYISMVPEDGIEEEFLGCLKMLRKQLKDKIVEELLAQSKVGNLTQSQKINLQEMLSDTEG